MNTSTTDKKYLSPAEAADQLAISAGTVRRLIKENKIEAYRFGNQIRIVADSLQQYVAQQKMTTPL